VQISNYKYADGIYCDGLEDFNLRAKPQAAKSFLSTTVLVLRHFALWEWIPAMSVLPAGVCADSGRR